MIISCEKYVLVINFFLVYYIIKISDTCGKIIDHRLTEMALENLEKNLV